MLHHDSRFEIKQIGPSGVFSGYGSVYDNVDQGDDIVGQGAFTDSLKSWEAKRAMPAMLWQHKSSEPCGAYTRMSEDSRGLFVEGKLLMKTPIGQYAYEALESKAVSGLSIGFITLVDSFDKQTGVRTINKANLMEVSIVTFPMNDAARVDSVKTIPDFNSISEFEKWLRDTSTLSRTDAAAVTSKAKILFQRDTGNIKSSQAVLDALKRQARGFVNA